MIRKQVWPDYTFGYKRVGHEVDCIIWATGFHTNEFMFPMEIAGAGGRSLRDAWKNNAHAHLGMTVPGFPSLVHPLRAEHQYFR